MFFAIVLLFGFIGFFLLFLVCITLVVGGILLSTKKEHPSYEDRKNTFRSMLKLLLILLCMFACCLVLVEILGSQVTFSM